MGDTTAASLARIDRAQEKHKYLLKLFKADPGLPFTVVEDALLSMFGGGMAAADIDAARKEVDPNAEARRKVPRRRTGDNPDVDEALKALKHALRESPGAVTIHIECDGDGNVKGTRTEWKESEL